MLVEDLEAIRRLIFAYPAACDHGDVEGIVKVFAHATLTMGAGDVLHGEAEVRPYFQRMLIVYPGPKTYVRHHVTNVQIDVAEDRNTARAWSYYVTFQNIPDRFPLQVIISGEYHDTFERVDGAWRFATRRFQSDMVGDISMHVNASHPYHNRVAAKA